MCSLKVKVLHFHPFLLFLMIFLINILPSWMMNIIWEFLYCPIVRLLTNNLYLRILSVSEKYDVSGYDLSHTTSILFSLVFIYQFIYLHNLGRDRLTSYSHRPCPVILYRSPQASCLHMEVWKIKKKCAALRQTWGYQYANKSRKWMLSDVYALCDTNTKLD